MQDWNPTACEHLIEEKLQRARLELLDDPRIHQAMKKSGAEAEFFLQQLMDEKFYAAATTGFEAVEASLRVEATDTLLAHGQKASDIRGITKELGKPFLEIPEYMRNKSAAFEIPPLAWAMLTFAGLALCSFLAYVEFELSPLLLVVMLGLAILPPWLFMAKAQSNADDRINEGVREYPARICRHYMHLYEEAYEQYKDGVSQHLTGEQDTPVAAPPETSAV